eukprot:CAMPEP_0172301602 /NCGR_PEP_ID=MMETSP1058-20130122/3455_1 /TAXON_ID=83371 /ORGANISM="Detonula confervacea, Strain CCMP 353" /LENGTH=59 /DNA_ID=CAMNT_0013011773 /DNA_START=18 /DNA_END=194 /DNA_ORIENTATION=+
MPNTNTSFDYVVGASLMAASIYLCTMPTAHSSCLCIVGASFMAASISLSTATMPDTNSP